MGTILGRSAQLGSRVPRLFHALAAPMELSQVLVRHQPTVVPGAYRSTAVSRDHLSEHSPTKRDATPQAAGTSLVGLSLSELDRASTAVSRLVSLPLDASGYVGNCLGSDVAARAGRTIVARGVAFPTAAFRRFGPLHASNTATAATGDVVGLRDTGQHERVARSVGADTGARSGGRGQRLGRTGTHRGFLAQPRIAGRRTDLPS